MSLQTLVPTLLTRYGEDATYRSVVAGTYSAATRSYSGGSVTTVTVRLAPYPFEHRDIDGATVRIGDFRAIVDPAALQAEPVVPKPGDFVVLDSETYRVESIPEEVRVLGSIEAYILHLRGVE